VGKKPSYLFPNPKCKITTGITGFLDRALQLDEHHMEIELKAEAMGAL
jgi:hypothetical protein